MRFHVTLSFVLCLCALSVPLALGMDGRAGIDKQSFGKTAEGTAIDSYTLTNKSGASVKIITYGARVTSIQVPDRSGKLADVALGYDDLKSYEQDQSYFGAIVGRYGNRIAKGRFTLGGVAYTLAQNNNGNHLHGGVRGFDKVVWTAASSSTTAEGPHVKLTYLSRDKEEGYPGNLIVTVIYTLTNNNELKIEYSALTDKETVLNLTHHTYFNLAGAGSGDMLKHELKINAHQFLPTGETAIPTGELRNVKGTPFDFTKATPIGARIDDKDEQLVFGSGYDHNFVLDNQDGHLALAAEVYESTSGRTLSVYTTEPGVQFYSGNFLKDVVGKQGKVYQKRGALCLEAQHYPDSPNQPSFPSTVLKPGGHYMQTTIYKFSVRK
jgi:aldose 1-epimerase